MPWDKIKLLCIELREEADKVRRDCRLAGVWDDEHEKAYCALHGRIQDWEDYGDGMRLLYGRMRDQIIHQLRENQAASQERDRQS